MAGTANATQRPSAQQVGDLASWRLSSGLVRTPGRSICPKMDAVRRSGSVSMHEPWPDCRSQSQFKGLPKGRSGINLRQPGPRAVQLILARRTRWLPICLTMSTIGSTAKAISLTKLFSHCRSSIYRHLLRACTPHPSASRPGTNASVDKPKSESNKPRKRCSSDHLQPSRSACCSSPSQQPRT